MTDIASVQHSQTGQFRRVKILRHPAEPYLHVTLSVPWIGTTRSSWGPSRIGGLIEKPTARPEGARQVVAQVSEEEHGDFAELEFAVSSNAHRWHLVYL